MQRSMFTNVPEDSNTFFRFPMHNPRLYPSFGRDRVAVGLAFETGVLIPMTQEGV